MFFKYKITKMVENEGSKNNKNVYTTNGLVFFSFHGKTLKSSNLFFLVDHGILCAARVFIFALQIHSFIPFGRL